MLVYVRTCVSITVDRQYLGFVPAKLILGYGIDREHSSNEDETGGTVNRANPLHTQARSSTLLAIHYYVSAYTPANIPSQPSVAPCGTTRTGEASPVVSKPFL